MLFVPGKPPWTATSRQCLDATGDYAQNNTLMSRPIAPSIRRSVETITPPEIEIFRSLGVQEFASKPLSKRVVEACEKYWQQVANNG